MLQANTKQESSDRWSQEYQLYSMLTTYYPSSTSYSEDTNYELMRKAINIFIKKVENKGLQE